MMHLSGPSVLPLLALALALTACGDKRPTRPDEASFRAMNEGEKCRVTSPRAITCADEIIIAQLRTMPGLDGADLLASEAEKQNAKLEPLTRKESILVHETSCAADRRYADAVFACWAIEGCKPFADCVMRNTPVKRRPADDERPADDDPPANDDPPADDDPPANDAPPPADDRVPSARRPV